MKTAYLSLLTCLALTVLCGPQTLADTLDEGPSAESKRAIAKSIETDALVQVFVHGLSVFQLDRDENGDLRQVTAHFPEAMDHDMVLAEGRYDGTNFEFHTLNGDFSGSALMVNLRPGFDQTVHGGPPGDDGLPFDARDAKDASWILGSDEVGGLVAFDPGASSGRLVLQGGSLETCALLLDTNQEFACRMKNPMGSPRFTRTVSEAMVLRQTTTDAVEVSLVGSSVAPIPIRLIELTKCTNISLNECVVWNKKYYKYLYDISISNALPGQTEVEREMEVMHGADLKSLFPTVQHADWNLLPTDCTKNANRWDCTCEGVQPLCWSHLEKYLLQPSALNVAACPLVDYP